MTRLILLIFLAFPLLLPAQPFTMFPGDANNDGTANQYDLLPIGVAYFLEGFPRPGATQAWLPQFHPNQWPANLPVSGVNVGFCDSDGNGLIDSLDIGAIALNFDSTQTQSQPPPLPYLLPDTCFSCPKPDLLITFDRDTAMVNDTFYATLTLRYPMDIDPSIGALGIAFNLTYDPENIRDSLTKVFPDTMPGDLMFVTATTTLARPWREIPPGNIGFGAAGKGTNALFFTRPLGTVELVVEDMIIRSAAIDFWMEAADILLVNIHEQVVCPGKIEVDTLVLFDPVDGVGEVLPWQESLKVFPNPASGWVTIYSPGAAVERVEVYSVEGRLVSGKWSGYSETVELNLKAFSNGAFLMKIKTAEGMTVRKIFLVGLSSQ